MTLSSGASPPISSSVIDHKARPSVMCFNAGPMIFAFVIASFVKTLTETSLGSRYSLRAAMASLSFPRIRSMCSLRW